MNALETRPVNNRPDTEGTKPFHPDTHHGFDELKISELPLAGYQGPEWRPTGFAIDGGLKSEFVGGVLKDRFFHNPTVGYSLNEIGMVIEYERLTGIAISARLR